MRRVLFISIVLSVLFVGGFILLQFFQSRHTIVIERDEQTALGIGALKNRNEKEDLEKEMAEYFLHTSSLMFPGSNLEHALASAHRGDFTELDTIINKYKIVLKKLRAVSPPKSLEDIHKESLGVVGDFVILLEDIRAQRAPLGELWNSERRRTIAERAKSVNSRIKEIVNTFDLSLSSQIMP